MKRNPLYSLALVIVFAAQSMASYCLSVPAAETADSPDRTIIKSPNDKREYRYTVLDNGIRAVLVSYPQSDTASVAIAVNAGSNENPDEWPGLAHLLEHTLFLGSGKYPDPDDFHAFIQNHGGDHNAWTSAEETVYFFSINQSHLAPALDRLSQFFIAPRLDTEWVDKERHAVDSEFQIYRQNDQWRELMVEQATMNQDHPQSRFSIGTLDTLKDHDGLKLQNALRDFHKTWYVSENIALVLVSSDPLEDMANQVKEMLGGIPTKPAPTRPTPPDVYGPSDKGKRVDMQSITQRHELRLTFPITPDASALYHKSDYYLTHLLGHESSGSLHSLLMGKEWIQRLFTSSTNERFHREIVLSLELTDKGYGHIDEIIGLVFDALQLIKAQGVKDEYFQEMKQQLEQNFAYMPMTDPQATAVDLVTKIFEREPADLIRVDPAKLTFQPEKIQGILAEMVPENMIVEVSSDNPLPEGATDQRVEPWMGMPYSVRPLTKEQLAYFHDSAIDEGLSLPKPNRFMAENLTLNKEQQSRVPEKVSDISDMDVWVYHDHSFAVPQTEIWMRLTTAHKPMDVKEYVLSSLFDGVLYDSLADIRYFGSLGGLEYVTWHDQHGMGLQMSGYNDKLPLFLDTVMAAIANLKIDAGIFARNVEQLRKGLENEEHSDPPYQLLSTFLAMTSDRLFPKEQQLHVLESLTVDDLNNWWNGFNDNEGVRVLISGNASKAERTKLLASLTAHIKGGRTGEPKDVAPRFIEQQPKHNICHMTPKHDNSALVVFQHGTDMALKTRAEYHLLTSLLSTPFYAQLRTEEQLGYWVTVFPMNLGDKHPMIAFLIQSPDQTPEHLDARVMAFWHDFQEYLDELPQTTLDELKQALMAEVLEPKNNLDDLAYQQWRNIELGFPEFDRPQQLAHAIDTITLEDLQALFNRIMDGQHLLKMYGYGQQSVPNERPMACESPAFVEQLLIPVHADADTAATEGKSTE